MGSMKKINKITASQIIVGLLIILVLVEIINLVYRPKGEDIPLGGLTPGVSTDSIMSYVTTATNETISLGPGYLQRVIVGENVTSSLVEISDNVTDSSAETFFRISGNTLQGVYDIGASVASGIAATVSGMLNATFIFLPK